MVEKQSRTRPNPTEETITEATPHQIQATTWKTVCEMRQKHLVYICQQTEFGKSA